jgi:hypothetical protein
MYSRVRILHGGEPVINGEPSVEVFGNLTDDGFYPRTTVGSAALGEA